MTQVWIPALPLSRYIILGKRCNLFGLELSVKGWGWIKWPLRSLPSWNLRSLQNSPVCLHWSGKEIDCVFVYVFPNGKGMLKYNCHLRTRESPCFLEYSKGFEPTIDVCKQILSVLVIQMTPLLISYATGYGWTWASFIVRHMPDFAWLGETKQECQGDQ